MALPRIKGSNKELAAEKRDYLGALQLLERAASKSLAAAEAQKKVAETEQKLVDKGHGDWAKRKRETAPIHDQFYGDLGTTKRGKALVAATNAKNLTYGLANVAKRDVMGFVTGADKRNRALGLQQNSFMDRLLGADKFHKGGESDKDVVDRPAATILARIEKNTHELLKEWKGEKEEDNRAAAEDKRSLAEAMLERKGTGASRSIMEKGEKKGGLMGAMQDGASGLLTSVFGGFAGASMQGIISKAISAAPVAAAAASLVTGLLWAAVDGFEGFMKSGDWGTSKVGGAIGGVMGGLDSGMMGAFKGAGKWALIGAGVGSIVPVVGTLAGGLVGAAVGAVLGWFGGEKIAKFIDDASSAVGKWSDKIFGTAFQTDPAALQKAIDDLKKSSDENATIQKDASVELLKLNWEIEKAKRAGNDAEVAALTERRDKLTGFAKTQADDGRIMQQQLLEAEKQLEDSKHSLLGDSWQWVKNYVVAPFGILSDLIFNTKTQLNEGELNKSIEDAKTQLSALDKKSADLVGQITAKQNQIDVARESGNEDLAKALENQLKVLEDRKSLVEKQREDQQARIDDASNLIVLAQNRLGDLLAKGLEWTGEKFNGLKDMLVDLASGVAGWLKKVFSWDYWFGESNKDVSKVKDDVQRAKELEDRKGRFVASAEKQSNRLFGKEDEATKSALADLKEGRIDETEFRKRMEGVRTDSTDENVKRDAGKILEGLTNFEQFRTKLDPQSPVSARETAPTNLAESNAKDMDTKRLEASTAASNAAGAVAAIVNNSTTVNNSSAVVVDLSPHNRDQSFVNGLAGTRNTAYGN